MQDVSQGHTPDTKKLVPQILPVECKCRRRNESPRKERPAGAVGDLIRPNQLRKHLSVIHRRQSRNNKMEADAAEANSDDVTPQSPTSPNAAQRRRPEPPYDLVLTIVSASHVAVGDLHGTSDVYVIGKVQNSKGLVPHESKSSKVHFRTSTHHVTRDPTWNEKWRIGGIREGTYLKLKFFDEDGKGKEDDKLGSIKFVLQDIEKNLLDGHEHTRTIPIKGYKGSKHIQMLTAVFDLCNPDAHMKAPAPNVTFKLQLLPTRNPTLQNIHLQQPTRYSVHYSSLANLVTTTPSRKQNESKSNGGTSFKAYKISLIHPPPYSTLEFHADIAHAKAFDPSKIHYRIFRHLVKKQYQNLYGHDTNTVYGSWWDADAVGPGLVDLLQPAHNKLFTFVVTMDGEWRFCETGDEYKINHLSKHGMLSDGNSKVVWGGEFFLREDYVDEDDENDAELYDRTGEEEDVHAVVGERERRWRIYLDNDSGTYSPDESKLGDFRKFMAKNLRGIEVVVKNFKDEKLDKAKKEQKGKDDEEQKEGESTSEAKEQNGEGDKEKDTEGEGSEKLAEAVKKPRKIVDILMEESQRRVKEEQERLRKEKQERKGSDESEETPDTNTA
ncbi:hypothetical protein Dda_5253 [Drechslerella dactyloides]|uniref:C2 domain-containing protein n=1 Tax=Drechslerella dactyloides TaxID=74499 RepID=A0AAD6NIM7_DREDA|nr:hypothetical protein Dda_5253 [Drechslerella dactyloides]